MTKFADWLSADVPHPADLIELELAPRDTGSERGRDARVRACIRPSGTEPKAKAYLEAVSPSPSSVSVERRRLETVLDAIAEEIVALLAATR